MRRRCAGPLQNLPSYPKGMGHPLGTRKSRHKYNKLIKYSNRKGKVRVANRPYHQPADNLRTANDIVEEWIGINM